MAKQETAGGSRKYLGLQVLRIVGAFMVLVTHSTGYASERLIKGFHIWYVGATGVDIFFVLSGFVMVYSSTKLIGNPQGWKIFAERRIVRIVPMYWLGTTLKLVALLVAGSFVLHARLNLPREVCSYLFVPAHNLEGSVGPLLAVGWTLYFEMFFYALFAFGLFLRVNIYKFVGFILVPLGFSAFLYQPSWPPVLFYLDNTRIFEFFYGMLIAKACLAKKELPARVALPLMVVGFAGLLTTWPKAHYLPNLLDGVFAAAVIYAVASLENRLTRIPRVVLFLADASYVIYLFHPLVAPAAPVLLHKLHIMNPWLSVTGSVCLGLAAGSLVHWLIEDPVTRWLQEKVRKRRSSRRASPPVVTVGS